MRYGEIFYEQKASEMSCGIHAQLVTSDLSILSIATMAMHMLNTVRYEDLSHNSSHT